MQFGWVQTHIQFYVVSGPKFTRHLRNRSRSIRFAILDILTRSRDIHDQTRKLSEIAQNFACFMAPNFFGGRAPELLDLHYKVHPDCNHVAKFHGDHLRELGGSPA